MRWARADGVRSTVLRDDNKAAAGPRKCAVLGRYMHSTSIFFFQAEDGIRDLTVTGVQTCALPIYHLDPHHQLVVLSLFRELARKGRTVITTLHDPTLAARFADRALLLFGDGRWTEIGRASCRERV